MLVAPKHEVMFTELSDIGDVLGEVVMTVDGHDPKRRHPHNSYGKVTGTA